MDDISKKRKETGVDRADVKREKIEEKMIISDLYYDLLSEKEEEKHLDLSRKLCTCFCSRGKLFIPCFFCELNSSNFTKQKEKRDILFCKNIEPSMFCLCDNCIYRNFYDIIRSELGYCSREITKTVIKIYYYFYDIVTNINFKYYYNIYDLYQESGKDYNSLYFNCFYYVIKNLLDDCELKISIIKQFEDMKNKIFDFKLEDHFEYKRRFLFDQ